MDSNNSGRTILGFSLLIIILVIVMVNNDNKQNVLLNELMEKIDTYPTSYAIREKENSKDASLSNPEGIVAFMDYFTMDSDSGETIQIYGACRDSDGLPTPANATISIYNDTKKINVSNMSRISTGIFYFNFSRNVVSSIEGNYLAEINCSAGTSTAMAFDNFQILEPTTNPIKRTLNITNETKQNVSTVLSNMVKVTTITDVDNVACCKEVNRTTNNCSITDHQFKNNSYSANNITEPWGSRVLLDESGLTDSDGDLLKYNSIVPLGKIQLSSEGNWIESQYDDNGSNGDYNYTVFVSSTTYDGNDLGSTSAGDSACQNLANGAGLDGTYTAWLSSSISDEPRDRGLKNCSNYGANSVGWILVDGTKIADDWNDLTDYSIDNAINKDENGNGAPTLKVYTGTNAWGSAASYDCTDWTSTSGYGDYGQTDHTNSWWSYRGPTLCVGANSIYCFQDGRD